MRDYLTPADRLARFDEQNALLDIIVVIVIGSALAAAIVFNI